MPAPSDNSGGRRDKAAFPPYGATLTELMVDFGLGVSPVHTYEIKRIDSDFFAED